MSKFFRVSVSRGSEVTSRIVTEDLVFPTCEELLATLSPEHVQVPKVEPCNEDGAPFVEAGAEPKVSATVVWAPAPSAKDSPLFSSFGAGKQVVDQDAKTRIEGLQNKINDLASSAGSSLKIDASEQFFETGTRMAQEGYSVQARRRHAFDKSRLVREVASDLVNVVRGEMRSDKVTTAGSISETVDIKRGRLYLGDRVLTDHALRQIVSRIESPSFSYLDGLRKRVAFLRVHSLDKSGAELAAIHSLIGSDLDKLAEVFTYELERNSDVDFKLRSRLVAGVADGEEYGDVFAAVSPTYPVADAPNLVGLLMQGLPADARGDYRYNPDTTAWEIRASVFTDTPVNEQAVGEPFEGYMSLGSADAGNGAFIGGGGINILRCLNASVYTAGEEQRRVHRGRMMVDVDKLVTRAKKAIDILIQAWGRSRTEAIEVPTGVTLEQAIPGIYRSLFQEKEMVQVLPGRKESHIALLSQAYGRERRDENQIVKSDIAQGWTRYIQDQPLGIRVGAEEAIGSWLVRPSAKMRVELKEDKKA